MRDRNASTPFVEYNGDAAIAFGTRNGCVFVSLDGSGTFTEVANGFPDLLSVRLGTRAPEMNQSSGQVTNRLPQALAEPGRGARAADKNGARNGSSGSG